MTIPGAPAFLGITLAEFVCFLFFWSINMFVVYKGIESIRFLLNIKAPLLIALGLLLLAWAYRNAGGFGPILAQPSAFDPGQPKAGQFCVMHWTLLNPGGRQRPLTISKVTLTDDGKTDHAPVSTTLPTALAAGARLDGTFAFDLSSQRRPATLTLVNGKTTIEVHP